MRAWLGTALAIVVALGGISAAWTNLAADNADTKRRVTTIEQRQEEDRRTLRDEQREIKDDVKDVKSNVDLILRKLDRMEDRIVNRKPPAR